MADETTPPPPPPPFEPTPVPSTDPQPPSDSTPPAPPPAASELPVEAQREAPAPEKSESATEAETEPPAPVPEVSEPLAEAWREVQANESPEVIGGEKTEPSIVESEKLKEKTFIQPAVSFKEESNLVSELSDFQRKSFDELKRLVKEALAAKTLLSKSESSASKTEVTTIESALKEEQEQTPQNPGEESSQSALNAEEISIWGVPLMKDERTDVILLKFLRARDFRVNDSFQMLKSTLKWRVDFGIDKLAGEDLGDDLEKVVFMHGHDREGHPVCYNVYGEFQNKELYTKTFSSEEKRGKFLRWRIQFLERSIRKLDFRAGGVNTIFQVNDLKNAPGPGKRELRQATRQALHLLQDNYPEFVAKQVFINVPWWYVAFYTMMSPFMTQRTKSKFVFAGPSRTAETLFKYISSEQVPIQYGGLSVDYCDCNPEFTVDDPATEMNLKAATKQFVEIICSEKCIITWEVRVVGWDVTYSAEFGPSAKDGYTVVIQKATKMAPNDDPVISGSFKVGELGKIVLAIDNPTFKRKKLLYRYKVLPFSD